MQRWRSAAALRLRKVTTRRKGTALLASGRRNGAGDFLQAVGGIVPGLVMADIGLHQPLGVGMQRRFQERRNRRLLNDAPGIHHRNPIRPLRDHAEIMGDQQHRHAHLPAQIGEQAGGVQIGLARQNRARQCGIAGRGSPGEFAPRDP